MSYVYAEMNELNSFQESLETTFSPLENEAVSQEDLIKNTQNMLEDSLHCAERNERTAEINLYAAQDVLAKEEAYTAEYNNHLAEDQERRITNPYYYEQVNECSQLMEFATARRKNLDKATGNFYDYCRRYHDSQTRLLSQYKELLKDSRVFFEKYIDILIKAKEAILQDVDAAAGGQGAAPSGGAGTSALDEADIEKIAAATGWDKDTIKQKCGKDGPIYTYKTVNANMENKLHTSGVFYERSKFEIGGVCFEGVFPKFNAVFEVMMPESKWSAPGGKYTSQFEYCNEQLKAQVAKDPVLASQFNAVQLAQIAAGITPAGYTWNHHQQPGRMQLVRKKEHNVSLGGASHTGGGALWCK